MSDNTEETKIYELKTGDKVKKSKKSKNKRLQDKIISIIANVINTVKNSVKLSSAAVVSIVAAVLVVVFIFANVHAGGVLTAVNGQISAFFTKNSTDKFSVNTNADRVFAFKSFKNGYMLLSESGTAYINASGEIDAKQQLSYGEPSVKINGKRSLVFDRGGNTYSLQRDGSLYAQQTAEGVIIDGDISAKNNYAIAVRGDKAETVLYGFNANGNVIYQWNCPDGFISDVSVTGSGGKAAAAVIDSKNAVLNSRVYILDFDYNSAYADFEFTDETVLGTKFVANNKVLVITDKRVYLINRKKIETVYDYNSSDICYCDFESGDIVSIITTDHSDDSKYILTMINKHGRLLHSVELSGRVRGVCSSDKCVSVLFTDKIETYSKRGSTVGKVTGLKHFNKIVVNGNYVYALSSELVKKYPAYGNSKYSQVVEDESAVN